MGLDGVELVMEIEEVFGIQITDDEAQNSRTVGDVYQIILKKSAGLSAATPCMTRTAFFRLRQAMLSFMPPGRQPIRPSSKLEQLIPREQRPAVWKHMEQFLGHGLPHLVKDDYLHRWANQALFWMLPLILCAFVATLFELRIYLLLFAIAGLSFIVCLACISGETFFLRSEHLPRGTTTVGDLAKCIKWNYHVDANASTLYEFQAARNEAWEKLVQICCRILDVKPEQVTPQAGFVDDLGVG